MLFNDKFLVVGFFANKISEIHRGHQLAETGGLKGLQIFGQQKNIDFKYIKGLGVTTI